MIKEISPKNAVETAVEKLKSAMAAVQKLATVRAANKLSFSRASNVAREIRDLIRVISAYEKSNQEKL